jgi:hypothetical protein
MFGTERPHSPLADRDPLRLVQRGGEFGSGPVGAVWATAYGALFDPIHNRRGQSLWNTGRTSRSPVDGEPIEAACALSIQPALQGPGGDPQVFSDLVMAPPPVGHQDSLATVAQTAVGSSFEGVFEMLASVVVQDDRNHKGILPHRRLGE